jgi:DNA-binding transcriptional LysR family regulator
MDEIDRIERRLKLRDVRVLLTVVQAGTMHKAAERLGTSQPAISRAIADLEHALGVPLLDRTPRGIEPTQYGRAVIKRGGAVFDELRQSIKDIEFLADPTAGELRIGCTEVLAAGPILAAIERLTRRHPRIRFQITTGAQPLLYRDLTARNIELAVVRIIKDLTEEHMIVEKLFDDSMVVVAGMKNPWTRRRQIELAELANEFWTLPSFDTFSGALLADAFRAYGLKPPRPTVTTSSNHMRYRLLATGKFLTVFPRLSDAIAPCLAG